MTQKSLEYFVVIGTEAPQLINDYQQSFVQKGEDSTILGQHHISVFADYIISFLTNLKNAKIIGRLLICTFCTFVTLKFLRPSKKFNISKDNTIK